MDNLEQRVALLEQWKTSVAVSLGKQEVDREYINKKFSDMDKELQEIMKSFKNLNYTLYAAIIAYLVKYAFDGGFAQASTLF